jgi:UDP-glucose 4-epimerase
MKIFVTGGAGFIGKHLVKFLITKGINVTIFDNFSNSERNSITYLKNQGVRIIEGDIRKIADIDNAVKDHDVVIHLAAKISVKESIENPSETFDVNVNGTKNVLNACEKNHIRKIIVSSSAAVYGESLPNTKLTEKSETHPISPYGESKMRMETEIKRFVEKHDVNYIILRFFNIFGLGQSSEYAGVITKFIKKIEINKPLEIFGDGMQTRDFISINDVVDSIFYSLKNRKNQTYNIASGNPITIKYLAELMISAYKKDLKIIYNDVKKGDIRFSEADISLAKKELQYIPKYSIENIKNILN